MADRAAARRKLERAAAWELVAAAALLASGVCWQIYRMHHPRPVLEDPGLRNLFDREPFDLRSAVDVIDELFDAAPEVRRRACDELVDLCFWPTGLHCRTFGDGQDPDLAWEAMRDLGERNYTGERTRCVLVLLCIALGDADAGVRRAAIGGLGRLGPAAWRARARLRAIAAGDQLPFHRLAAAAAVFGIAKPPASSAGWVPMRGTRWPSSSGGARMPIRRSRSWPGPPPNGTCVATPGGRDEGAARVRIGSGPGGAAMPPPRS